MEFKISKIDTIVDVDCFKCGVVFWVSKELQGNWLRDKTSFYCPNGHSQAYTTTAAERLQKLLDIKERELQWKKDDLEAANKEISKLERKVKKLSK